jgi:hypothetical protein
MRADPRELAVQAQRSHPTALEATQGHRQWSVAAVRNGSDTTGFGPDALPDRQSSADTVG